MNCASIGCPSLWPEAFTSQALNEQLDAAAQEFLQHSRAVRFEQQALHLSSLFKWYAQDFGANLSAVLTTLSRHLEPDQAARLTAYSGGAPLYDYDWSLNGYCHEDGGCG